MSARSARFIQCIFNHKHIGDVCPYLILMHNTVFQFLDFSINIFGGSGMKKMKMMILTTLFVVWSLVSDCEDTDCVSNKAVM